MKSWSGVIVKLLIYGVQTIALGFPPRSGNFASRSPKVLVTESLPGKTLWGPKIWSCSSPS